MKRVKNVKLYKLSLFLLGLMVLVNFSFCLMPLAVSAQILNESQEIIPETPQKNINFNEENNCEDAANYKTELPATKTEQSNNTQNKNSAPLCCLDHDRITKINNVSNQEISDLFFYASQNENLLDPETLIQNSSYIQPLDLPPPKADILFSVCKKE